MTNLHDGRELIVFHEFASVCPLGTQLESIEKRDPPEPDIFCKTHEQTALAFEMVELVDRERIARPFGDQLELMDTMRDARNNLPAEVRAAFLDAWIGVKFRPQSLRKRKAVAEELVNELTNVDPGFKGEFALNNGETEVARVCVKRPRGIEAGPHFRVLAVGHFEPIPIDAISAKFRKRYQSDVPIELLAYYDRQHAPLEEQLAELIKFC